jgi:hypothetical protein
VDGEEQQAVVSEAPPVVETEAQSSKESNAAAELRKGIVKEVLRRLPELVRKLVDGQGQIQHFKLLFDVLEDAGKDSAAELNRIERSLANEWGVEPDWQDGCCAHCGRTDGLRLDPAA